MMMKINHHNKMHIEFSLPPCMPTPIILFNKWENKLKPQKRN